MLHLRSPDGFHAYLRATVVNLVRSHRRRKSVETTYLERRSASMAVEPPDLSDRVDLRSALMGAADPATHGDRAPVLRGPVRFADGRGDEVSPGRRQVPGRSRDGHPPQLGEEGLTMDDWLRDGLRDIASGAPTALEVPGTMRRRARGRMTITILTSLAAVVALGIGAVAGVRALGTTPDVGDDPLPPDAPSSGPANVVTATLADAGCTSRSGEIEPGPIRFVGNNTSASRAVFDIGIIQPGHSFEELVSDVEALGSGVVARSIEALPQLRPPYFRGSLRGRDRGHASSDRPTSLFPVTSYTYLSWSPTARVTPPGTRLAIICYRFLGSFSDPAIVPAGVLGPFDVR